MTTLRHESWKELRAALAWLAIALLVAAAASVTTWKLRQETEATLVRVRQEYGESQARLARADDELRERQRLIERYRQLSARGRLEPERRLEWAETLAALRSERGLPALDYEIAPQRDLYADGRTIGGLVFRASAMRLHLPLVHEGDLLGLLDALQSRVDALLLVRRCRIERVSPEQRAHPLAGLAAECELDWITVQEK